MYVLDKLDNSFPPEAINELKNVGIFLLILLLILTILFIATKLYKKYVNLIYTMPFGIPEMKFLMSGEEAFELGVYPYRQHYDWQTEIFSLYYHTEIIEIYSKIIYNFTNEHAHQLLTSVQFDLECECFMDSKKVMAILKDMIIKHYKRQPTINEYEENNKKKTFTNRFRIKSLDFEFNAQMRFLTLKIIFNP